MKVERRKRKVITFKDVWGKDNCLKVERFKVMLRRAQATSAQGTSGEENKRNCHLIFPRHT